jgi:hypothetical protein
MGVAMATTVLTIKAEEHTSGQKRPGRPNQKPGDLSWFSDNITSIKRKVNGGAEVNVPPGNAHESGFCIYVRDENAPGGARWLCQGGWELPEGQIHSRGLMDFTGGPDFQLHAAILGGTGPYDRAMGEITGTWHSKAGPPSTTDYVMTIET